MTLPQQRLIYIIQEVIHKYAELQQQFHNKSEDYENELASCRMWQARLAILSARCRQLLWALCVSTNHEPTVCF